MSRGGAVGSANRPTRRLGLRGALALAFAPTVLVLVVFAIVDALTTQRLLLRGARLDRCGAWP